MKKSILVGLIIAILLSLSACGQTLYIITTKDGREYVCGYEPKVNPYNWVIFETTAGLKVRLPEDKVADISKKKK